MQADQAARELVTRIDQAPVADWLAEANQWLSDLPDLVGEISLPVAVLLVPLGIVSLLYGFRIFKGMVVVYSSVAGAAAGWWLVTESLGRPDLWWVGLLVGAVLMAVLAWPLANVFVGIYGAVAGGLAGYAVTQAVGDQRTILIGVGVGVLLGAVLAAVVFRLMIILTTSVLGAHLAVIGVMVLLYRVDRVAGPLKQSFSERSYLLSLVVAVPALVGIVYQLRRSEKREHKDDSREKEA